MSHDNHDDHHHDDHQDHAHEHEHHDDASPETHFARRAILQASIAAGTGAAVLSTLYVGVGLVPKKIITPEKEPVAKGDVLVYGTGPNKGQVINPKDIKEGEVQTVAFPKGKVIKDQEPNNTILLSRPSKLDAETTKHAADGLVAYSGVCKHLGCVVSQWDAKEEVFVCPCHMGRYDPKASCKVVGPPPPAPLPQLPIKISGDQIIADDYFLAEPGKA